jgi:CPA1 family monovalent cation:H+ antiporter
MENFKIIVFIMAILISLMAISDKRNLPYPILLMAAGLIIGFIPVIPDLALDPDVIFLIILPPLLYDAAFKTSWHEFKTQIRPIATLAITLVFFTTFIVAVTAYYLIPGFTWPLAFLLGAIVSPPDAVAATGIIKGLRLNRQVITILEGESLVNDASALIAYRYAVAAVTTGSFVLWKAGLQFLVVAGAGVLIGVAIGYLFVLAHKKIQNNTVVETSLTLLAPFISYLAAEELHVSGILAVVSSGLVIAWRSPEVFSFPTRMRTRIVWDTVIFLLHGFVFILIGLQVPFIIKGIEDYPFFEILAYGLLISLATILVRILWVFVGSYWRNIFKFKNSKAKSVSDEDQQTWKNVLIVAWTGTRGVISLATALAIPLTLRNGQAFPQRNSIIFLSFVVIFMTLVVQGLSLPLLIRMLGVKPQENPDREEKEVELHLATNTLQYLDHEEFSRSFDDNLKTQLKRKYEQLVNTLTKEINMHKKAFKKNEEITPLPPDPMVNAQIEIKRFQRELLVKLHKEGEFSDAAIRQVEQKMDIDELKLNLQLPKDERESNL